MLIGLHISISGGIEKAPKRAYDLGCECFQIFSRRPYGGDYNLKFSKEIVKKFRAECEKYNFNDYYIHAPYYINFASSNNKIFYASVSAIKKELEAADLFGAKYVITHLGSAKDLGQKEAIKQTIKGIDLVLAGYEGEAKLLIEISAGAGNIIGDSFDEIGKILKGIKNSPDEMEQTISRDKKIGVCFDTAHSFESGYDLRTDERIKNVFTEFDKKIGLNNLALIHCNDSKTDLGSHSDRHEDIGKGKIGLEGLQAVVAFAKSHNINIIAELDNGEENLEVLREMRGRFLI